MSKLARMLSTALTKLAESRDPFVLLSEIAEWNGATVRETAHVFKGSGLSLRRVTKLGQRGKGYSRLELQGLQAELAAAHVEPEQAPERTWFCRDCSEVWDTTEREPACPECSSADVKLRPPSKAPASRSEKTSVADAAIRDVVESYGMTDYTNQRPMAQPVVHAPATRVSPAANIRATFTGDVGNATGRAPQGQMGLSLATGTGKAVLDPTRNARNTFTLPPRKGAHIVARTQGPLPRPV